MKKIILLFGCLLPMLFLGCAQKNENLSFETFGIRPNTKENASPAAVKLIEQLQQRKDTAHITVVFPKGRYDFYPEEAFVREYYVSNHDQDNPKQVGFAFEGLKNITIDGQGSELIFHGRMVPFALLNSRNITLKNLSIDFELPALQQLNVLAIEGNRLTAEIYPRSHYRIDNKRLVLEGEGYEIRPSSCMAFSPDRRLTYNRQDVLFYPDSVMELAPDTLIIDGWKQTAYTAPGERFVLRSEARPTPGIFVSECYNTVVRNVTVHYAEGMALLAQLSENITLDGFNVKLRGEEDPRYFTTQADATHFSGCKGTIISQNGLYEGMADDAINVHGTYLRVTGRVNDNTLQARYMHPQAWGFKWGEAGDKVQFIESEKMEIVGDQTNTIRSIKAVDKPSEFGAKEFEIEFTDILPTEISEEGKFGIENLTWTPEVFFTGNTIRNNRARGALFSTPKRVVCEDNLFDHTHGTAILLCGDCNGWFETGACTDVVIRGNTFVNALTANYQFTNAVISIYPEIPDLERQKKFFHSGIVIENNTFDMFDHPIVYAKSTDGLIFRGNRIRHNTEFKPFHWNSHPFLFERVANVVIENNVFDQGFNPKTDIKTRLSDIETIKIMP